MIFPLSPAHFAFLAALHVWVLLLVLAPAWAWTPMAAFVASCLAAPFLPRLSFYLPITSRGPRTARGLSLTFDGGPDPRLLPELLAVLARHGAKATFFVTGAQAELHPDLLEAVLAGGHTLGNHGYSRSEFLMFASEKTLRKDLAAAQAVFQGLGVTPLAYRPPLGFTNPRLWRILLEQGLFCVNFSVRALDLGNRRVQGLAARLLRKSRPGDVVLLHAVAPAGGNTGAFLGELEALLQGYRARGLELLPLERLLDREIMQRGPSSPAAVEVFYDGFAATYDQEQFGTGVSLSRRTELALFQARLPGLLEGADRILEVGAGTGIFTTILARHAREVVALDISDRMLAHLRTKCAQEGLANVEAVQGDAEAMPFQGPFSAVCAFSSLAYLKDLPAFLEHLQPHVAPGGTLYFLTARTSLPRFFTQIGNAMRQGLWLQAYSRRELDRMLRRAGFEPVSLTAHLLKSWCSGGMLLEVVAKRPLADFSQVETR